jgi:predicted Fe-Mo cluster-binding NifX family protein
MGSAVPDGNPVNLPGVMAQKMLHFPREVRMKLAMPIYQGRIAPVFETCRQLVVVSQGPAGDVVVAEADWSTANRSSRPMRLKELGVEVLLCGGITSRMEYQIRMHGVFVVSWLAGEMREVLVAFRQGRLAEPKFSMPGRLACSSDQHLN